MENAELLEENAPVFIHYSLIQTAKVISNRCAAKNNIKKNEYQFLKRTLVIF
jgi:hypothetical protein